MTTTCAHYTCGTTCAQGVNYLQLAGGGVFTMLLRLPCLPLSNRRGEVARTCTKYQAQAADDKAGEQG